MSRTQITFRAGDSERFQRLKEAIADHRGVEPSNAEVARMMMDQFDPDAAVAGGARF